MSYNTSRGANTVQRGKKKFSAVNLFFLPTIITESKCGLFVTRGEDTERMARRVSDKVCSLRSHKTCYNFVYNRNFYLSLSLCAQKVQSGIPGVPGVHSLERTVYVYRVEKELFRKRPFKLLKIH